MVFPQRAILRIAMLLVSVTLGYLDRTATAHGADDSSGACNDIDRINDGALRGDITDLHQARGTYAVHMLQSEVKMLIVEPSGETNLVPPHESIRQALADAHIKQRHFEPAAANTKASTRSAPSLNSKLPHHTVETALPLRIHALSTWDDPRQALYKIERYQPVPDVQIPQPRNTPYSTSRSDFLFACTSGLVALVLMLLACRMIPHLRHTASRLAGISAWTAEFLGTFIVVFTAGCCAECGSELWNPVANGSILMIMVYLTYPVSDGHLNPAVSLSLALCGKLKWAALFKYWAAQFSAGIAASVCFTAVLAPTRVNLEPVDPFRWQQAFSAEVIFTLIMCFVFCHCIYSKSNNQEQDGNQFFGLAIGYVTVAGGFACNKVSGACFNPAVALALDMSNLKNGFFWCFVFILAECLGAYMAAVAFRLTRPEDYIFRESFSQYTPKLVTKCTGEFFAILMLGLTVALDRIVGTRAVALSTAAVLTSITYAIGDVSGGHFNPAVTAAVVLTGRDKCSLFTGTVYIIAQTLGGVVTGLLAALLFHSPGCHFRAEPIGPKKGIPLSTAGMAEMFYTFVLAYTVLATTTVQRESSQKSRQNFFFALAIGSCVNVGGCAIGAVTGCLLNPALQVAMMLMDLMCGKAQVEDAWINLATFVFWQLLGGLGAAVIFRITHWREYSSQQPLQDAAKYFCEIVGTFTVVATAGCVNAVGDPIYGPAGIGLCVLVMMYNMTPISKGHLNPAVSLTFGLCRKMPTRVVFGYWIAQMGAGLGAGICVCGMFWCPTLPTWPPHPFDWQHSLVAEVAYTFLICFVVINCVESIKNNTAIDGNQFYGLAAGYAVIAGSFAARSVSGAPTNPAVTFGLGSQGGFSISAGWTLAWLSFQAVGACLAALMFRLLRPEDFGRMADPQLTPSLRRRCLSEFVGTFMMMLTLGLSLTTSSLSTALTSAAVLTCLVYAIGDISSALFNPAVTLAMTLCYPHVFSRERALLYAFVQLAGGAAGGVLYGWFHYSGPNRTADFRVAPGEGRSYFAAGVVELAFTCLLCYTVLATMTVPPVASRKTRRSFYFALCIGSCSLVGSTAAGAVSGAQLNPAICLGLALAGFLRRGNCDFVWQELWTCGIFSLWELAGGTTASVLFHLTYAREFNRAQEENHNAQQQISRGGADEGPENVKD